MQPLSSHQNFHVRLESLLTKGGTNRYLIVNEDGALSKTHALKAFKEWVVGWLPGNLKRTDRQFVQLTFLEFISKETDWMLDEKEISLVGELAKEVGLEATVGLLAQNIFSVNQENRKANGEAVSEEFAQLLAEYRAKKTQMRTNSIDDKRSIHEKVQTIIKKTKGLGESEPAKKPVDAPIQETVDSLHQTDTDLNSRGLNHLSALVSFDQLETLFGMHGLSLRIFRNSETLKITNYLLESIDKNSKNSLVEELLDSNLLRFSGPPLFVRLLDPDDNEDSSRENFYSFAIEHLCNVSQEEWPNKTKCMITLLETSSYEEKLKVAEALATSQEATTAQMGEYILQAINAESLRSALPALQALKKMDSGFTETVIDIVFGYPFVSFVNRYSKNDPDFTTRLSFNGMRHVFVHNSLMIGVYNSRFMIGERQNPPYLLAYDLNTHELTWGFPLTTRSLKGSALIADGSPVAYGFPRNAKNFRLEQVGNQLSLHLGSNPMVLMINADTGEIDSSFQLPAVSGNAYDKFHMHPTGVAYQMLNTERPRKLLGGTLTNGEWQSTFELEAPEGFFCSLSTHCGFQDDWVEDETSVRGKLVVFGPRGDQVTIPNCVEGVARDDKLYTIEIDPEDKNKCYLKVRILTQDTEVVSPAETTIPINGKECSIEKVCSNGQVILFRKEGGKKKPIFIDLSSKQVQYSQEAIPGYAKHFITDTGLLLAWDEVSKNVRKISSDAAETVGKLEAGRGTSLLHASEEGHLYFVDIPY